VVDFGYQFLVMDMRVISKIRSQTCMVLVVHKKNVLFGIIVIDVKGLMMSLMSYYDITIHTTFPRLIYIYRSTSILKKGCM
jgi:hypothetical protein